MAKKAAPATLALYRGLLRAGRAFPDYNVRDFIGRRTRQEFRDNAALSGAAMAKALEAGREQLALVQRQSLISGMYVTETSAMEGWTKRQRQQATGGVPAL